MRQKARIKSDIIIVGGGHSGLALAAGLGAAGMDVVCLERALPKKRVTDGRTLALSYRSMQVLDQAGVAALIKRDSCPIYDIRVADQGSSQFLDFHHREVGDQPFGWIIENALFDQALRKRISQLKGVRIIHEAKVSNIMRDTERASVTLEDGCVFEAALIVGADGRNSQCRALADIQTYGWDYYQTAIVCTIRHSMPHQNVAVEHFQPGGPFATLPMLDKPRGTHRSSIVWTEKKDAAQALLDMSEEDFTERLHEKVKDYLGEVALIGMRYSFPLQLQHAEYYTASRLALIGDAAHGIHPIAGQGFNLGMGDIDALIHEVTRASQLGLDVGNADVLRRFEKNRKFDNGNMVLMTDLLDRLFSNALPPVQAARRMGLGMVQHMPALRRFFMRTAMGLQGARERRRAS